MLPTAPSSATALPPATSPSPHVDDAPPRHPMVTRARAGIYKPNPRYAMAAGTLEISPLPSSARAALRDPNWHAAMQWEFDALKANHTWRLISRPANANIMTGKWVFKHKYNPDSSLDRYKACWVVRGFTQRVGIDFGETFMPMVKPATIRTILTLIAGKWWPVRQLDVSNTFLHGHLDECVLC